MTLKIAEVQPQLRENLSGIRWVAQENLHFTLKFLGSIDEHRTVSIVQALKRNLAHMERFTIRARGLGVFPNITKPRILWVGLHGEGLHRLARQVESVFEPMGFGREKRGFAPHLTIGRWRRLTGPAGRIRREIERWKDYDFGQSRVEEVILFQSLLQPNGAVYCPLGIVPLEAKGEPVDAD